MGVLLSLLLLFNACRAFLSVVSNKIKSMSSNNVSTLPPKYSPTLPPISPGIKNYLMISKLCLKVATFDSFYSILTDKTSEAVRLLLHNSKGAQLLEKDRHFSVIVSENRVDIYIYVYIYIYICLTSLTRAKCGVRSTLCWKIPNISASIELFAL